MGLPNVHGNLKTWCLVLQNGLQRPPCLTEDSAEVKKESSAVTCTNLCVSLILSPAQTHFISSTGSCLILPNLSLRYNLDTPHMQDWSHQLVAYSWILQDFGADAMEMPSLDEDHHHIDQVIWHNMYPWSDMTCSEWYQYNMKAFNSGILALNQIRMLAGLPTWWSLCFWTHCLQRDRRCRYLHLDEWGSGGSASWWHCHSWGLLKLNIVLLSLQECHFKNVVPSFKNPRGCFSSCQFPCCRNWNSCVARLASPWRALRSQIQRRESTCLTLCVPRAANLWWEIVWVRLFPTKLPIYGTTMLYQFEKTMIVSCPVPPLSKNKNLLIRLNTLTFI